MKNDPILNLLGIYQSLQDIDSLNELSFFMSHQTAEIYPYRLAVVWDGFNQHALKIKSITTLAEIDSDTVFSQALCKLIANNIKSLNTLKQHNTLYIAKKTQLTKETQAIWPGDLPEYVIFKFFKRQNQIVGGLAFFVQSMPEDEKKLTLLEWTTSAYDFSWNALLNNKSMAWKLVKQKLRYKKTYWMATIVIIVVCLIPVNKSVMAPVEIVSKDAAIITAPMDGVVESIKVAAGDKVQIGEVLILMERRDLVNAHDLAEQEYLTAEARYEQAIHSSFKDVKNRAEIKILGSILQEKEIEKNYTNALLNTATIKSPITGLAIVNDVSGWFGKPVQTGQKIMEVAIPKKVEALVWLPVANAINFKKNDAVSIYLNNDPLLSISGSVQYMAYQAELSPDNVLSYRVAVSLNKKNKYIPRIGTEGTARIKGDYTILFNYLFRKPISYIRQTLGL